MFLKLMYITNNLKVALIAQKNGVDRIWIDLETIGKEKRQPGKDTVKSNHKISDIAKIRPFLTTSEMLVRVNSLYDKSASEINDVIDAGADIIMLPYWKTVDEVKRFIDFIDGRCKTTLLLETKESVDIVDDILNLQGIDEIHIGLNDLYLSYGLDFMFEPLINGTVEILCKKFNKAGIPYGFGGIAKIGEGAVPAEKIIMEHYRLGSTRAILSRSFCDSSRIKSIEEINRIFSQNIEELYDYENNISYSTSIEFERNRTELIKDVNIIVERVKKQRKVASNG